MTPPLAGGIGLVIEAALAPVQAGLLRDGQLVSAVKAEGETLDALFAATDSLLCAESVSLAEIDTFFFGAGPGTLLGLRVAAMAIEGWRGMRSPLPPVFQYTTLRAVAAAHRRSSGLDDFDILISVRRDIAARAAVRGGVCGELTLEPVGDEPLAGDGHPRFYLPVPNRRLPPPAHCEPATFSLDALPAGWFLSGELEAVSHPAPFNPVQASYVQWSGARHRA